MGKKYFNLGSMIEKRDKQSGEPVLDDNEKRTYYIKIDPKSEIIINGEKVTGYLGVARPRDKLDFQLKKGKISAKEHAEKIARFESEGDLSYITFELTAAIDSE